MAHSFKPVMLAWWRFGKEHERLGEDQKLQVNPSKMISAHHDAKIARFRGTPANEWNWWQVNDDLIVERKRPPYNSLLGEDARFFYLLKRGIGVMTNCHFRSPYQDWQWYFHVADFYFDAARDSWIMKDLFCDIIVHRDGFHHRILDLHDLGDALDLGLITPADASQILRHTDSIVTQIAHGEFPFPEILQAQAACEQLGWD